MTPLTMPQSGPTKLKPSTEAPRETTAARLLFPRRVRHGYSPPPRCCPPISSKGRLHLVDEAINLVCVISLVDGSPSKSDCANLIRSQVLRIFKRAATTSRKASTSSIR